MPRRRRKLSPEMEKKIESAKRKVELVSAIINDIEEEEIQIEYKIAFEKVRLAFVDLRATYDLVGFNEDTELLLKTYFDSISVFEAEYEI